MHLTTQFHAEIDSTDGDKRLDPVNAQFGHSSVIARGVSERKAGTKDRQRGQDRRYAPARREVGCRAHERRHRLSHDIAHYTRRLERHGQATPRSTVRCGSGSLFQSRRSTEGERIE